MENLTDTQKIEKLWGSLETEKKDKASLQLLLEVTEAKVAKQQDIIQKQQGTIEQLSNEIKRLGKELNAAREAAANSVREYIAEVS
jgi:predicted  nucleic acid-binding Zn-ribbon protein